ncbi:MAG: hypothetical protein ACD_2C00017G0001 [uncultured bacterium (gcode 4)]|uniref:Uncharacterized protein n=1 Tax=uncultured bacterium (gcode 4) TaxID=1234023 RepID=K2GIH8_9BACT|nr:MAG: hypothetical protein ACD_2C00017G0001 [uncultured bacterium (gcode 4)]
MLTLKWQKIKVLKDSYELLEDVLLANRNINPDSKESFFSPKIWDLHDPFLFEEMDACVDRIIKARDDKERVVVFWDYDVDWVSSTAMLVKFFHEIWIQVSYRLPHRVTDGYWLKSYFFDDLKENKVSLVVTVDCWTRDIEALNHANSLWIDVIITDHHTVPEIIPQNIIWLINPKNPKSKYPNKWLSWSWVAFKLLHALSLRIFGKAEVEGMIKKYIDFAMLWTIADCMELKWENRVIAYLWLKQLKHTNSHWLKKLLEWSDLNNLDADVVWFKVWPRLNAAGRMDTPYKALKVLLAWEQNLDEALAEIENLNLKRKESVEKFIRIAKDKVDTSKNVIFYDSKDIEHGIIWLIAWRLCEAHNKISIVLKDEWEKLVWSVRWPSFLSLIPLLDSCKDLFEVYGWHDQAAWFTIPKKNFVEFAKKIEHWVKKYIINVDSTKTLIIDTVVSIKDVDSKMLLLLNRMMPYWIGNQKPLFLLKNIKFDQISYLWKDQKHLKFAINWSKLEFKAFWMWEHYSKLVRCGEIAIVFELEKNIWNWRESLSLNIKDIII